MDEKELKSVKGKIDKWSMEPKKPEGKFIKLLVSGKTYNFFDIEFFEQNEYKFKIGNEVEITYWDKQLVGEHGPFIVHTVEEIKFLENAPVQKPVTEFAKASEAPVEPDDIETLMKNCLRIAFEITDKYKDDDGNCLFNSEDVRAICNSLFMESCKRRR